MPSFRRGVCASRMPKRANAWKLNWFFFFNATIGCVSANGKEIKIVWRVSMCQRNCARIKWPLIRWPLLWIWQILCKNKRFKVYATLLPTTDQRHGIEHHFDCKHLRTISSHSDALILTRNKKKKKRFSSLPTRFVRKWWNFRSQIWIIWFGEKRTNVDADDNLWLRVNSSTFLCVHFFLANIRLIFKISRKKNPFSAKPFMFNWKFHPIVVSTFNEKEEDNSVRRIISEKHTCKFSEALNHIISSWDWDELVS